MEARLLPVVDLAEKDKNQDYGGKMNQRRKLAAKCDDVIVTLADRFIRDFNRKLGDGWHVGRPADNTD